MVLVATFGLAIPMISRFKTREKSLKMLTQQILVTFKPRYLGNGTNKCSKLYHLLGQDFELFLMVMFAFEELEKLVEIHSRYKVFVRQTIALCDL